MSTLIITASYNATYKKQKGHHVSRPTCVCIFFMRHYAMHVKHDNILATCTFVRPSVRHIMVLYLIECTYRQSLSTIW